MTKLSQKTRFGQMPGYIGASLFVAGSAYLNARFGYGLGGNMPESVTYSGLSIASDLLKATAPIAAIVAWHNRDYLRAGVAVVFIPLAVTYSLVSASGFAAETRSNRAGDNIEQQQAFDRASVAHKSAASEIARITSHKRWTSTASCADATVKKSIAFCEINKPMYQAAVAKIAASEAVLAIGRPAQADPQAAMIGELIGIDETRVSALIGLLLALLIELGSTFGFLIASGGRSKPRTARKASTPTAPVAGAAFSQQDAYAWLQSRDDLEASNRQLAGVWGTSHTTAGRWIKAFENEGKLLIEQAGNTRRIMVAA